MQLIIPGLYQFTNTIAGRIYMIADPDGVTLVDTGMRPAADIVLDQLAATGRRPTDIKRILITHAHPDHADGLPKLKEASGAQVIASAVESPFVQGQQPVPRPNRDDLPSLAKLMYLPSTPLAGAPVDREVNDGDIIAEAMGGLQVIATPGHAPGHVSYWQPQQRVLFVGDVMMRLPWGLSLPVAAYTPDMDENKRSIKRLAELDARVACFGHGPPIRQSAASIIREFAQTLTV
ncbi:MAG: MBL fold metallo-hydrolase [Chloroflexi bacterium]|nr:MBL fold metallo-hydrolase [Chloroflexota bacterium]